MAKRRASVGTQVNTKKSRQVLPAKSCKAKAARAKKREADNGIAEEEEKLERKIKPKPRLSSKLLAKSNSPSKCNTSTTTDVNTSKYFQSPVKEEETDSEDFDMVTSPAPVATVNAKKSQKDEAEDSEEDEDDWEEVEELDEPLDPAEALEPVLPSQPMEIEIEIETPEVRKKKKIQAEFESYLRRMMNKCKKDLLIDTHKVHLMCLIASGMFRNRVCSEPDLLAITLSLLPAHYSNVVKERIDQNYLSGLLKWFRATFTLNPSLSCEERPDLRAILERRLASLSARNHQDMTQLFLLVLRSLQLFCRLVVSLQPIPLKPPSAKGKGARTSPGASGKSSSNQETSKTTSSQLKVSPGTKRPAAVGKVKGDRGGKKAKRKEKPENQERIITSGGQRPKNSKRRTIASKGVGMPQLCSQNATSPVTYVVSVDGDGFLKDLGRKYDPTWMTSSRKRRVDEDWWDETLEPFLGPEYERDKREDKELQNKLINKPLPISIAEYKNHPLYALKRHMLKYEAIYPSTAAVLGYCRGEPVYSRDCVHTLHSKDTWLKEARTVRLGEEPFKMVRGFSNRSRKARINSELKENNDLALFGEWQTEEYQPPIAVDGRVPRNDFGNVYLFKPCMLPVGCVHLSLPNLHRVAKKLDMDAAPAVTGFDFHAGYSHAVTDGYIVCEEHEEILRAAWVEEQEIQKQKDREKRENRVVSNWTLLVKGLLIRERLKQRYCKKNPGLGSLSQGDNNIDLSSDEEAVARTLGDSLPGFPSTLNPLLTVTESRADAALTVFFLSLDHPKTIFPNE
ncbi:unnamed protein product [Pleuronectes platessa]|uniref:Xeroderma pigmentosum, complementation group C n=1 Tax=Pleuronectes platessa TaxID=8262 RepID=A0A9N7Y7Z1_PLEPL|nr:unnamed protein product [Pleuronectes platessa]